MFIMSLRFLIAVLWHPHMHIQYNTKQICIAPLVASWHNFRNNIITAQTSLFLADRTAARSVIGYWYDTVVRRSSVRL